MAVVEGGWWSWAGRLQDAADAVLRAATWLGSPTDGPFSTVLRTAASDVWGGPFADQLRGALSSTDRAVLPWTEHLFRLHTALDQALTEVKIAMAAEGSGVPSTYDLMAALTPWRSWPVPSLPLGPRWAHSGRGAGFVWVYPDRARQLDSQLWVAGEELRAARRRLAAALALLLIDAPVGLDLVANAADEIATEVLRRVEALEEADRRTAGTFATIGEQLGFPGSLAPPADFDPAELRTLEQAGATTGPGKQSTQATEADPVSVATGNYLHEMVDLALSGRGLPTVFSRTYNSFRAAADGSLGFGWSTNLGVSLRIEGDAVVLCGADGREERHAWEVTGDLSTLAGGSGRLQADAEGFLFRSEDGVVSRFDGTGRLVGLADPSGNETVLERDEGGRLVRMADPAGRVTSFESDAAGRITALIDCLGGRVEYAYDDRGNLAGVTDAGGGRWSYAYDEAHRLIGITDPEGRLVVTNAYDEAGRVVEQHDGGGNRWTYAYLPGLTVVTDPLAQKTVYAHDARFRTTAVTDPPGAATRFSWDDADRLVAVLDPAGGRISLAYDDRGRLAKVAGPGAAPVGFEWDADDNLVAVVSAEGHRASFEYDEASRPIQLISPAGVETQVAWRPDGLPESITEGAGATTRFGYDDASHPASITDPLGAMTTVVFDPAGRPVSEVHPGGAHAEFGWDAMGRLVSVTEAHGATSRYEYDRSGRLVVLTDALGRITRYDYEGRGLLAAVTDPLGRVTTFAYDPCGRLASRTDPQGPSVAFAYDPAGRLAGIEGPGVDPVSYRWDRSGRLAAITDSTGTTTFKYDAAGHPVAERHDRSGVDLLHAYDTLGRRRRLELRRNNELLAAWEHDYDADGRITRVLDPAGADALLTYDAAGRLAETRHANGVTSAWAYDAASQPVGLTLRSPGGEALSQWDLSYDTDGNRTTARRTWTGGTRVASHGYDKLGRLIQTRNGQGGETFVWDDVGNRLTTNGEAPAAYDAADELLTTATAAFRHDAAGNLVEEITADRRLSLGYDVLGRPAVIRTDDETVTFGYDGLGRRTIRADGTGSARRIYDGASVVAEIGDDSSLTLETTAGLLVLSRSGPEGTRHLHPDAGTNVTEVTDEAGRLLARYAYSPFGERTTLEGDPDPAGPLGFGGILGVRDAAGGLLDMRARLYHPRLGRFTSPDPWPAYLPAPVTLNRYLYALGDPVGQVDPLGLFCWTGKSHGKCRGLHDVVDRGRELLREATPVLSTVATITSTVAVIAAGVSLVCPPCAVAGIPIATAARGIGTAASVVSWAALGTTCAGAGINFDCAVGVASRSLLGPTKRFIDIGVARSAIPEAEQVLYARFGKGIAGLFLKGTTSAGKMGRPGK